LAALEQQFVQLEGAGRPSSVANDLAAFGRELEAAQSALGAAASLSEVQQARRRLRHLRDGFQDLVLGVQAARQGAAQASAEAALAALRHRLEGIDRGRSERFDPAALADVERALTEADKALGQKASAKCLHLLKQARAHLDQHLRQVQTRFDAWAEERDSCHAALAEAADRVGALAADPIVGLWASSEAAGLAQQVAGAQRLLDAEQFTAAVEAARGAARAAEEVVTRAQERQLREDRRRYVVRGIVEAMGRLGFVVQAGSPSLENPADKSSATIIHAQRIGGGAVAVSVPQEGDIWYDVADFPMQQRPGPDGQVIRSCDEAEAQIERLHGVLADAFGIQMDKLRWEGKAPEKVRKQADRLPDTRQVPGQAREGSL
jgi:hypothetical protein